MYSNITDIFFDLDHTLWDFDRNSEIAFERIFEKELLEIDTQKFIQTYAPINQACWKLYQKNMITHEELRYNRLRETFDVIEIKITDNKIDEISNMYIEYMPDSNFLFEGAIETLDYLKAKYKLHIITNGFAVVQEKKLTNSNLKKYFKTITNSQMAEAKKPSPIIFNHALRLAKAKKEQSVMIGDCIDADVQGALDFGMKAIFFNPNQIIVANTFKQITNLVALKKIF